MKKVVFRTKKMTVRALMALGAMLGIASCAHTKQSPGVVEDVYGPPQTVDSPYVVPDTAALPPVRVNPRIEPPVCVYGPPEMLRRHDGDTEAVLEPEPPAPESPTGVKTPQRNDHAAAYRP